MFEGVAVCELNPVEFVLVALAQLFKLAFELFSQVIQLRISLPLLLGKLSVFGLKFITQQMNLLLLSHVDTL